jgi:hypothetical protein
MRRSDQYPSAELPLLIGLSTCLTGAGVFALFMYWLFQPLHLENPGMAAFQPPKAFTVQLATSGEPAASLEEASVLAAAAANAKDGGPAPLATAQAVEPKPKAKTVAQAKPRRPAADPYRYRDEYPRQGYAQNPYSGFGSWF